MAMDAAVADIYRAQCYLDVQLALDMLALSAELRRPSPASKCR